MPITPQRPLSDAELADLLNQQPASNAPAAEPQRPLSDAELAALLNGQLQPNRRDDPGAPSQLDSFIDHAVKGFSMGFDADAKAGVRKAAGDTRSFGDIRDDVKNDQDASRATNPWSAWAGEMGGSVAAMALPVGWLGRLGAFGRGLSAVVPELNASSSMARAMSQAAPDAMSILPKAIAESRFHNFGVAGVKSSAYNVVGDADGVDNAPTFLQSLQSRIPEAFDPTRLGVSYALGGGLGLAGEKVGQAVSGVSKAASWPRRIGDTLAAESDGNPMLARAIDADARGADKTAVQVLDELKASVLPTHKSFPPAASGVNEIENAMMVYGKSLSNGASDTEARAALATAIRANEGGAFPVASTFKGVKTADTQAGAIADRYAEANATPEMLHEGVARLTKGEAPNTLSLYSRGLNAPRESEAAAKASQFARERQGSLGDTAENMFTSKLGSGDPALWIAEAEGRIAKSADIYKSAIPDFNASPAAQSSLRGALNNALAEINTKFAGRTDDNARAALAKVGGFAKPVVRIGDEFPELSYHPDGSIKMVRSLDAADGTQQWLPIEKIRQAGNVKELRPTDNLEGFIGQRAALRGAKDVAYRNGNGPLGTAYGDAQAIIDNNVRALADPKAPAGSPGKIFAQYWDGNDTMASAKALERSFEAGSKLPIRSMSPAAKLNQEKTLQAFDKMHPEHQELFKRGLMLQLQTKLRAKGMTDDVAKTFNSPETRNTLARVLGKNDGVAVYDQLERMGRATRTFNLDKRSPTANILLTDKSSRLLANLKDVLGFITHPTSAAGKIAEFAGDRLSHKAFADVVNLGGVHTNDPYAYLQAMHALRKTAVDRSKMQEAGTIESIMSKLADPVGDFAKMIGAPAGVAEIHNLQRHK